MYEESVPSHIVGTDVDIESGEWASKPIPVVYYPSVSEVC